VTSLSPQKAAALQRQLEHQFADHSLLELAMTHRSRGANNYERLEFLGDSILGFVIADWLYVSFPDLSEGRLSRMRSSLVRKETLAEVARSLNLSDYLILGEGELKSGGFNRDSILSDTVESLIGALFLDADLDVASQFIRKCFQQHMQQAGKQTSHKDPKSRLQEAMQKQGFELPSYEVTAISGQQHEQTFTVSCKLSELAISAEGEDRSRRRAEQAAAEQVLIELHKLDPKKFKAAS